MSEPDSAEKRRRRSAGQVHRQPKPVKMRPKSLSGSDTSNQSPRSEGTNHGPRDNNARNGCSNNADNCRNNAAAAVVVAHSDPQQQEVVANGDVLSYATAAAAVVASRDNWKKRRSQSEGSEGSPRSKNLHESDVRFMWTQANGHSVPVVSDTSPVSPEVFYSPTHDPTTGDDMNGYASANAHMLALLEINGDRGRGTSAAGSDENVGHSENLNSYLPDNHLYQDASGNQGHSHSNAISHSNSIQHDNTTLTSHGYRNPLNNHSNNTHAHSNDCHENGGGGSFEDESQSDKIDEGIALAAELEFMPLHGATSNKLSTSSEDQGDFIETDISLQVSARARRPH